MLFDDGKEVEEEDDVDEVDVVFVEEEDDDDDDNTLPIVTSSSSNTISSKCLPSSTINIPFIICAVILNRFGFDLVPILTTN